MILVVFVCNLFGMIDSKHLKIKKYQIINSRHSDRRTDEVMNWCPEHLLVDRCARVAEWMQVVIFGHESCNGAERASRSARVISSTTGGALHALAIAALDALALVVLFLVGDRLHLASATTAPYARESNWVFFCHHLSVSFYGAGQTTAKEYE